MYYSKSEQVLFVPFPHVNPEPMMSGITFTQELIYVFSKKCVTVFIAIL